MSPKSMTALSIVCCLLVSSLIADPVVSHALNPRDPSGTSATRFARVSPKDSGIDLIYRFPQDAPFVLMTDHYSGGGICIGDVDGDSLPDVYCTHYDQGNRLYKNLGGFRFQDITEAAGVHGDGHWCGGACFVDIDNDGDLDLSVSVFKDGNLLYINDGKGRFEEQAERRGLSYKGAAVMTAFSDMDLDGYLDVYVLTHRETTHPMAAPPRSSKEAFEKGIIQTRVVDGKREVEITSGFRELFALMDKGEGRIELITAGQADRLFRNNGNGQFVDVTEASGIAGFDIGLAATWWDANNDRYPDLYVSNDYKGPDRLYINRGDGTFEDRAATALPHTPWLSMGSDFADLNRDGYLDFLATDMAGSTHYQQKAAMGNMGKDQWFLETANPRQYMRNALYINTGGGRFLEAAFLAGLARSDWTWCPKFGDFDNDGWMDLYITNGMSRDFMNSDLANKLSDGDWRSDAYRNTPVLKQKNLAFRNLGDLAFQNVSYAWGLDQLTASYGAATGDLDQDGDLDLVVMCFDEPLLVLRNLTPSAQHAVSVALRGVKSNRLGIGARVTLESASGAQTQELASARGFMSANEPVLHFGLGEDAWIKQITVRWPSGITQTVRDLPVDRLFVFEELK